jgi:hypothetical protein
MDKKSEAKRHAIGELIENKTQRNKFLRLAERCFTLLKYYSGKVVFMEDVVCTNIPSIMLKDSTHGKAVRTLIMETIEAAGAVQFDGNTGNYTFDEDYAGAFDEVLDAAKTQYEAATGSAPGFVKAAKLRKEIMTDETSPVFRFQLERARHTASLQAREAYLYNAVGELAQFAGEQLGPQHPVSRAIMEILESD